MKRILAVLGAALMVFAAAGCSPEPEPEPQGTGSTVESDMTLNLHLGGEPTTIDPAFVTADDGGSYALHLFEGLTALDREGNVIPAAAESWKVEEDDDGLTVYTFTIREGAVWTDGVPVKAQDFVYAWLRVLDPKGGSPSAYQLYPIRSAQRFHEGVPTQGDDGTSSIQFTVEAGDLGMEAVDDATLKVTLEGSCPDFLELLALPAYCPVRQDAVEANPDSWTQSVPTCISNGRYMLKEWNHDQNLTLVENDLYWGEEPASVFLNFILSSDTQAVYTDFTAGRLQYASAIPPLDRPAQEEAGALTQVPRAGVYAYLFNTAKAPFDKAEVRRAVSLAVDREALAEAMGADLAPAWGLVPDGIPDALAGKEFSKVSPPISSNTAEAQRLLAGAGYPGGKGFPEIIFITNDTSSHLKAAQMVQKMLADSLGITMTISSLSTQQFQEARADGEWHMARGGSVGYRLDPAPYLAGWDTDASANYGKFSSEDYDALLEASLTAPEKKPEADGEEEKPSSSSSTPAAPAGDKAEGEKPELVIPETRMEILHAMERLLVADEAAVVPLWQYREPVLTAPGLTGVVESPLGYRFFQWASYTRPAQAEGSSSQAQ